MTLIEKSLHKFRDFFFFVDCLHILIFWNEFLVRTIFFWSFILLDFYPFLLIFNSSSYSRDNIYINKCFSKFVVCLSIFLSYFFLSCKVFNFYGVRFNVCFTESGFRIIVREISYIQVIIIQLYLLFILVWFCFLH